MTRHAYAPQSPVVAIGLLLAFSCNLAHAAYDAQIAPGVCSSLDIRNSAEQFAKLHHCRVIEGQLSIVLMEWTTAKSFENISFPELREVTGYIKIYRVKGIQTLGDMFPNLSVIRGQQLFKDFALVVFDNENLQSLGLRSLNRIERGGVRIQHNDHLCYASTIDWSRIIMDGVENNIIRDNYEPRFCTLCPNAQGSAEDRLQCPTDSSGNLLCWDDKHCQRFCPMKCNNSACTPDGLKCCHDQCVGGCDGPTAQDCHVCRSFSLGYGKDRKCVEHCPAGFYELLWRCVTEQECRALKPPVSDTIGENSQTSNIPAYKIMAQRCVYNCPSGYMEVGDIHNCKCEPCPETGCVRECAGGKVDSITSAEQYRGCTHIKGTIEISLRALGGSTMGILESSLGEIRYIEGALRVSRSYPLVSLMFFKNLKMIAGKTNDNKAQSLYIFNNPNLELLWDWTTHGPIVIEQGKVFIHFNPKLCYNQISPLKNMTLDPISTFSENEVSAENNGDKGACTKQTLNLEVQIIHKEAVLLKWGMYCPEDIRKLLGFSVYYIAAEHNVTLYEQRDACSDTWSVKDISVDDVTRTKMQSIKLNTTKIATKIKSGEISVLTNTCHYYQPVFHLLAMLTPYTRYAVYVKTYTTQQDKNGGQSPIIYFRTLPDRPSPPIGLAVEVLSPHSVTIRWSPPILPNGTIAIYHVEIQVNNYNKPKILAGNVNFCGNPTILSSMISVRNEEVPEKHDVKVVSEPKNGTCACQDEPTPGIKFNSRAEAERVESITFENYLQNQVYKRNTEKRKGNSTRTKRSAENSVNSMLVIVTENIVPKPDLKYKNVSDEGYVTSLYYELSGDTRSLTVINMRHFTWYTVYIWACRSKQENETIEAYNELWCSDRTMNTFRTLELHDADAVSNVQAEVMPSNKTLGEVNVTWDPPKNPNGFVVAYNVHYTPVEDNVQTQDEGVDRCVSSDEYESNGHSFALRNIVPGNYCIRVTPVTVSGAGNVSMQKCVLVPAKAAESGYEWIWGVIGGCVIVTLVLVGGIWYAKREFLPIGEANKLIASVNPEYVSTMYVPDEWEVPRENIKFIKELGQGSFGMVYEGIAKNIEKGKPETRCAVKTVNEHATDRERIEFLNEASVMKAFDTFHVVRLLGVVSRVQPTLVVMELMEFGDLKTYLRSHRPDAESSLPSKQPVNPPTLQNILQMAIEIADGMAYLSAKKFVHRDLAARNCMVAGDLTVKVGDFGMTRDIYETDYYRKGSKGLLPVRWMSPESLKDGVFSSYSDVWSYGVVLWEMATLAMQPYQGLSNEQVVRYVGEGGVMERPEHCPDRLYDLMRACWAHRPAARPAFLRLVADLAPTAAPYFRHRSFFHSPQGQEFYALQRNNLEEEHDMPEVNVGAVATGSGSNLFGVSGRLASWVRELSSLRSRTSDDAAAEPLRPLPPPADSKPHPPGPNGLPADRYAHTGC